MKTLQEFLKSLAETLGKGLPLSKAQKDYLAVQKAVDGNPMAPKPKIPGFPWKYGPIGKPGPMLQGGEPAVFEFTLGGPTQIQFSGLKPNTTYQFVPLETWQVYPDVTFQELNDPCPPGGPEDIEATMRLASRCVPWMAERLHRELIGRQLQR